MFRQILISLSRKLFITAPQRILNGKKRERGGLKVLGWTGISDREGREKEAFDQLELNACCSFEQCFFFYKGERWAREVHSHTAGTCPAIIAGGVIEVIKQ